MVINHRKKNSRHRGSWTHGYGEKKKHRGAGHRGGRGRAGSGKKGDAKKPRFWKIKGFAGKHGFVNHGAKKVHTISISQLNSSIEELVRLGNAIKEGDVYKVNFEDLGAQKLLGTGVPAYSFEIVVAQATKGAIKKIEEKGGSVSLIVQEATADSKQ